MTDVLLTTEEDLQRSTITRALREIQSLKHELQHRPPARSEIAVVSAACRLPRASTPEEFWDLLVKGDPTAGPVPGDRWDNEAVLAPFPGGLGTSYADSGSFLVDPFDFDPAPFGMSPREAASTDPHHRLVLLCAWEALERAGIAPTSLRGSRTGVFVGMSGNDFERHRLATGRLADIDGLASMGSSANFAANRLSFALGLQGPSLVVDTACSSSLVALHQARRALEEGECDLAVVAGVNVMLSAEAMIALSQSRMLSPTGRCHTFSDRADGYARGEGCVVVVLRRVDDQVAHAATPLGILLATAVNQDGPTSGITVPSGRAQADLIRQAIKSSGVSAEDVDYVEAHGTGTPLGDPIELRALASVHVGRRRGPLLVGATKPVTGHLEGAAGLVGLLKCLMVVQHGTVPAQPLDGRLTDGIDWEATPLSVPTSAVDLAHPLPVAGVSSFGYGGTNAHAIVRRWNADRPIGDARATDDAAPLSLRLSGASSDAVAALALRFEAFLRAEGPAAASRLCAASLVGQADLTHRLSVVGSGAEQLQAGLRAAARGRPHHTHVARRTMIGSAQVVDVDGFGQPRAGDLWALERIVPGLRQDAERLTQQMPAEVAPLWLRPEDVQQGEFRSTPEGTLYFWAVIGRGLERLGLTARYSGDVPDHHDPSTWLGSHSSTAGPGDVDVVDGESLVVRFLRVAHSAWCGGASVVWHGLRRSVENGPPIPTYPWRLTELRPPLSGRARDVVAGSGLNLRILRTGSRSAEAHAVVDELSVPLLREHTVHGRMVVPGVVFMELVLRLAEAVIGTSARVVSLNIARPCLLGDGEARPLHLTWDGADGAGSISVASGVGPRKQHHVTAVLAVDGLRPLEEAPFWAEEEPVDSLDRADFYRRMWPAAFHIGPSLTLVEHVRRDAAGDLYGELAPAPDGCAALRSGIRRELLVLDAAIQVAGALRTDRSDGVVTLGTGFSDLFLADDADFARGARVRAVATGVGRADVMICSPAGAPLAVLTGVTNLPVSAEQLTGVADGAQRSAVADLDRGDGAEGLVRRAIATVLRTDPAAVAREARLEDLMDSILLVELGELLAPHAPGPLGVPDLLDAESVEGLIDLLDTETASVGESDEPIAVDGGPPLRKRELTVEAMVALAEKEDVTEVDVVSRDALPKGILLTGATGFVGSFLLHELLSTTERHVYCLVRAEDEAEAGRRLRAAAASHGLPTDLFDDRVSVVVGDLTHERFGLDATSYEDLLAHVGEIFHNAGAVKWTSSYEQLAPHNVGGTAEILRFATAGSAKVVHFTSTVGVFSSDRVDLGAVDESVPLTQSDALMVGYAQTKWVSEMMIRRAGEQGLRFTIHRINSGPSSTASGFNRLDHLSLIIKGCVESGLAPLDGPFPVQAAPIDHVARAYVRLALNPAFEGETSHLVNEPVVSWSEFFEHVRSYGYPLTRMPFDEWRTAVTGRRSGTLALLGLAPFLTRTIDDVRLANFAAPGTRSALGLTGPWCPVVDRDLVHTFLDGFVAGRFFPAPTP
ncbi:NAD-dependent epimerase/dehydratase family protein [Oerskovia turbata]|uniref:NAD-dependent epimerase/dehydratase family protein n=1 Tax=Oerskovia turbata TaxID=1713 RepID=A0A4Q1KQ31_9CELL|nr:thioester reductase domain-containing protein [Oerskovia turbata]RXR23096.1 NAD-dependent epimerase/dehydratase family protein [Oerskovia turbata]RXR31705.1 NAD-dependent epimerase/dehydratase family protein [Oerskovia turbata]TGJ97241.1 hypothetical protein DLJ96_04345 [Actinotalea fermentans ATCC 43279 = JCM 9966 = DSM 3133]